MVGWTVTKAGRPDYEHGAVVEFGTDTVVVRWHLKYDVPSFGAAGMNTGKVFEDPKTLSNDVRCPFC